MEPTAVGRVATRLWGQALDSTSKGCSSELLYGRPWKSFKENLLTRRVAKDREWLIRDVLEFHSWKDSGMAQQSLVGPDLALGMAPLQIGRLDK